MTPGEHTAERLRSGQRCNVVPLRENFEPPPAPEEIEDPLAYVDPTPLAYEEPPEINRGGILAVVIGTSAAWVLVIAWAPHWWSWLQHALQVTQ